MPENSSGQSLQKVGVLSPTKRVGGCKLENTAQYDLYEDKTQREQSFSQLAEDLEPTPEESLYRSRDIAA